jgi:SAM-dependent methyltransferase
MGLWRGLIADLVELVQRGYIGPGCRVAEIGEQQLSDEFLTADDLLAPLYGLMGRDRPNLGSAVGIENFTDRAPPSAPFWRSLGLGYAAFDLAGREAVKVDLNRARVPFRYRRRFDLVINGGTTEHVANQANAFRFIHDLTKPGGIMIHGVPSQGMLTHGLVNYTMKFFGQLCEQNRFEILSLRFGIVPAAPLDARTAAFGIRFGEPEPLIEQSFSDCYIVALLRRRSAPFAVPMDLPVP